MKKVIAVLGVLGALITAGVVVFAGPPQDQPIPPQGTYYNTTLFGSTTSVANMGPSVTLSVPSAVNSGGGSYPFRNCFTKFVVQMSSCSVFTVTDGPVALSSTSWSIYGSAISSAQPGTIVLPEDHLGPVCGQFGNNTTLSITTFTIAGATGQCTASQNAGINYEGYTTAGPGSNINAGK